MSDFTSMLGNLQKSVTKATHSTNSRISSISTQNKNHDDEKKYAFNNNNNPKKRCRINIESSSSSINTNNTNNQNQKRKSIKNPRPTDVDQLSITLSFLCIGAQKAGTSWLHQILSQHSNLSLPIQKEIHFWDWHRHKGLGWYSNQFPKSGSTKKKNNATGRNQSSNNFNTTDISNTSNTNNSNKPCTHLGEITPCYVVLPDQSISEIKYLFPNLRLIFIARNIVDRAWSALVMELRNAVRGIPQGTFSKPSKNATTTVVDLKQEQKYQEEGNPQKYTNAYFMERLRLQMHTERCNYATHLRQWLQHYPSEQLLILNYQEIQSHPKEFLTQICRFLNIPHDKFLEGIEEKELKTKVNEATGSSKCELRCSLRKEMEEYLEGFRVEFNKLLDELGYDWNL